MHIIYIYAYKIFKLTMLDSPVALFFVLNFDIEFQMNERCLFFVLLAPTRFYTRDREMSTFLRRRGSTRGTTAKGLETRRDARNSRPFGDSVPIC